MSDPMPETKVLSNVKTTRPCSEHDGCLIVDTAMEIAGVGEIRSESHAPDSLHMACRLGPGAVAEHHDGTIHQGVAGICQTCADTVSAFLGAPV